MWLGIQPAKNRKIFPKILSFKVQTEPWKSKLRKGKSKYIFNKMSEEMINHMTKLYNSLAFALEIVLMLQRSTTNVGI